MNDIRISFLVQGLDGGIASLICSFVPALVKHGFQVQCLFIGSEVKQPAEMDLVDTKRVSIRRYVSNGGQAGKIAQIFRIGSSLQNEIDQFEPELIVCAGILPAIVYGLTVKNPKKVPVLFWEHGPQNSYTGIKKAALKLCSRAFSGVISPSWSSLRVFLRQFPFFDPLSCSVLENGIPANKFVISRRALGLDQELRIIMPARMDGVQKNQESLIRACASLIAEGRNIRLTLTGNGPAEPKLIGLVQAYNLGHAITIKDYTNNVAEELASHNVLCLSSHWEGFGLVLVEGMFSGMLVMGSDVTGIQDVIQHGETGLLFQSNSSEAIAAALKGIQADSAAHERMARAGHRTALHRWTTEHMAEQASLAFRQWNTNEQRKAA